jgi:diguanylate cyclase (GGDEF)-like protein
VKFHWPDPGGVVDVRLWRSRRAPRISLLLGLVLLIPVTSLAAITGAFAITAWSGRQTAVAVRADVAQSSAIMATRALVVDEGLPSIALANSAAAGVDVATLTRLSGVDFPAALQQARPRLSSNQVLREYPKLAQDLANLQTKVRPQIDSGRASYVAVLNFFTGFSSDVDTVWQQQLNSLRRDIKASHGASALTLRVGILPTAYAVLTTAVQRAINANEVIRDPHSTAAINALIESNGAYNQATVALVSRLGPKASAAQQEMLQDPAISRFDKAISQTISASLQGRPVPLASDLPGHTRAFTDGRLGLGDLQRVILAASADVSDAARSEELAATHSFQLAVAFFLLSVLLAAGAAILLTRSVVQPLRRLANAARRAAEGDFTVPENRRSGPREVADTIHAVDDITAVLAAVESFTVTLAYNPTAASLDVPLPGRTGLALQTTLDRLRESVREAERQRNVLREVATRDGLTGLLNRNAALDAVRLELARAERLATSVMVLFIDLDGLKTINDTHGHRVGDDAIRLAADALRSGARASDVVARLGGDEFLISGGLVDSHSEVQALADRLHAAVAESMLQVDSLAVPLRCSIGIAISEPGDTAESLINKADQALYTAKKKGRNQTSWRLQPVVPQVPRQDDHHGLQPEILA